MRANGRPDRAYRDAAGVAIRESSAENAAAPSHTHDDCAILHGRGKGEATPHMARWTRMTDKVPKDMRGDPRDFTAALHDLFPSRLSNGRRPDGMVDGSLSVAKWMDDRAGIAALYSWADQESGALLPPARPRAVPAALRALPGGVTIDAKAWNHIIHGDARGGG